MIPRLFDQAYRPDVCDIDTNGIGPLPDSLTCTVKEATDGTYQLSMTYPVGGLHWEDIDVARAIVCAPNDYTRAQPFIIKKISKPMAGVVQISADHVSYDANGVMVQGFNATGSSMFRNNLMNSAINNPFMFQTDFYKAGEYIGYNLPPKSLRAMLLDKKKPDSFVNLFGGEFEFDRFDIKAHEHRGSDRGVQIRYGKNLLSLTQNRSIRDFATACYPYWYKEGSAGGSYQELPEKVLQFEAAEYSDVQKCVPVNLTNKFKTIPTIAELRQAAYDWINENWEVSPPDNFKINFVELGKTTEYADLSAAESVQLYDTITVVVPHMHLNKKMRVIKTIYDVLKERYASIEIGTPIDTFADTILKLGGGNA